MTPHVCPKRALRRQCAELFGVEERQILSASRRCDVVVARHAAAYALRQKFGLNYTRIGNLLCRDHSTAIYACRVFENKMRYYPDLKDRMRQLGVEV